MGRSGTDRKFHRIALFSRQSVRRANAGLTCVPPVVTGGPGRRAVEGVIEVEDGPGQDHDVVDVEVGDDDLGRHSDACRAEGVSRFCVAACWNIFEQKSHPGTTGISSSRL